jgi:hypothetical protein
VSLLAIDLSDRALTAARGARVLAASPGVVFDGSTGEAAGTSAWHMLRRQPTAVSTRHLPQLLAGGAAARPAALLSAQLAQLLAACPREDGESVFFAVPAQAAPAGLSALLGVARPHGLAVAGFADAAAAQAAALGLDGLALVIELGLHHLCISAVERAGTHVLPRRWAAGPQGWLTLQQAWLELLGRTLVEQTRFDPLHGGDSEQQLFEALPELLAQATAHGSAPAVVGSFGQELSVMISHDQLAASAQPLRRELLRLLHSLKPAGRPVSLVVPALLFDVPGLAQDLDALSGCELISVPEGFAAAAASVLELPPRAPGQGARLLRRLPVAPVPLADGVSRVQLSARREAAPPPSHVLLGGEAHPLGAAVAPAALVVGRDPGEPLPQTPGRVLRLGSGLAGVSRRHCTFLCTGGEVVLLDHSRFGTFVNGERVAERVRVHAGDRVRLGDPGVTLSLIAVGGGT